MKHTEGKHENFIRNMLGSRFLTNESGELIDFTTNKKHITQDKSYVNAKKLIKMIITLNCF